MLGDFIGKTVTSLPTWTSSAEGTMVYNSGDGKYYYGSSSAWIDRILFPFDSGTSQTEGYSSPRASQHAGANNDTYGYVIGGYYSSLYISNVSRFIFPFYGGTATQVGTLADTGRMYACCDTTDFNDLFV